jgi:type I restriction enzyme S subunit
LGVFEWRGPETGIVNQHIFRVVPNEKFVDRNYLRYALSEALSEMGRHLHGATMKHVNRGEFLATPVFVPPLPEQRRIATILDQADALRSKRREALAKLDEMAQAIFVQMFVSDEGKHEAWPRRSIGSLAVLMRTGPFGSQLLHSEFVEQGIAVLGIDNAVSNQFAWGERRFITERKYRELSRFRVFPSDVIVTIMGTCGRVAIVPDDIPLAITTKHLCSITLDKERCLPGFLHACLLRHPEVLRQLGAAAKGAVMPGLNMGIIKGALIPVPPLPLQAEFVKLITSLADMTAQNNHALSLSDNFFSSLQHRAFSGDL